MNKILKKGMILTLLISMFSVNFITVEASEMKVYEGYFAATKSFEPEVPEDADEVTSGPSYEVDEVLDDPNVDCEDIVGAPAIKLMNEIFGWMKIAAPIMVIMYGTYDFAKAAVSNDPSKELKTAQQNFTKRLIAALLLFLLPFILETVLGAYLSNPTCGIEGTEITDLNETTALMWKV